MAVTGLGFDLLERSPSEEAQQLSACACVMSFVVPVLRDSPLCIGHSLPSAQHAMRASGVGAQPAQTAAFPIVSSTVRAWADNRRLKVSTCLGCWTHTRVSTADAANTSTMQQLDRRSDLAPVGSGGPVLAADRDNFRDSAWLRSLTRRHCIIIIFDANVMRLPCSISPTTFVR